MKKELCSEAVLAYKNALRNNPSDDETRYNLALAKKCEEEQEQNKDDENKDDQQNKNDENKDDQQNKNDESKDDQQDKDDENMDDENKDNQQDKNDENKDDQRDKDDKNKDNKSEQPNDNKSQQSKLSPQQIKNLLKAMENAEKKVQAKVNDKKQKGTKVVSEKDW